MIEVDRQDIGRPLSERRGEFRTPRYSPDGARIAVHIRGPTGNRDIWIVDPGYGAFTRLTFEGDNTSPVWSAAGQRIAGFRGNAIALHQADGSSTAVLKEISPADEGSRALSWSQNGRALVYPWHEEATGAGVWVLSVADLEDDGPLLNSPFDERDPAISPDGRWLAFTSNATGQDEVYVTSMSAPNAHVPVSVDGGDQSTWARNTGQLFYRSGDRIVGVSISTNGQTFAVTDLKRILMSRTAQPRRLQRRLPPSMLLPCQKPNRFY